MDFLVLVLVFLVLVLVLVFFCCLLLLFVVCCLKPLREHRPKKKKKDLFEKFLPQKQSNVKLLGAREKK